MHLFFFVIAIQLLLPPFWILMLYLWVDAHGSGWNVLAWRYRATEEPTGRRFEKATISMNARSYRGNAVIAMNSDGLYVKVSPAFFVLHPPLLIPWRNMRAIEVGPTTEFELAAAAPVRLRLNEPALHEAIRQLDFNSPECDPIPRRLAG